MKQEGWRTLEARAERLEAVRARAEKVREGALKALGRVCPKCFIPKDSRDMRILPLSEDGKKWSKQLLFRRIAEAPIPLEVARLVCKECLFNENQDRAVAGATVEPTLGGGTGELFWIGGQRVEQMQNKGGISKEYGCLVIYHRHEDLRLGPLEEEG